MGKGMKHIQYVNMTIFYMKGSDRIVPGRPRKINLYFVLMKYNMYIKRSNHAKINEFCICMTVT